MPPRFRLNSPEFKLSENDVENAVLDFVRIKGYYPIRLQSGLFRTPDKSARFVRIGVKGLPDYICVHSDPKHPLPVFFMEVKGSDGRLDPDQISKIAELEVYGFRTAVVSSVEELAAFLDTCAPPPRVEPHAREKN